MDGCTIHTGWYLKSGYGGVTVDGKTMTAHAHAWEQANGCKVGAANAIHHLCHNRACVDPEHLQRLPRGDHSRMHALAGGWKPPLMEGEDNPCSVLTEKTVSEMVAAYTSGALSMSEVARQFGASVQNVHMIVSGRAWKTVTGGRKTSGKRHAGEGHYAAKLCAADVVRIREEALAGETASAIAGRFGVSRRNVGMIVNRKTWRSVA